LNNSDERRRREALWGSIWGAFTEGYDCLISRMSGRCSVNWRELIEIDAQRQV
jgi:hypothetical protein